MVNQSAIKKVAKRIKRDEGREDVERKQIKSDSRGVVARGLMRIPKSFDCAQSGAPAVAPYQTMPQALSLHSVEGFLQKF
jgi:hypothetical protein